MQTTNSFICALLCLAKFGMDLGFATMNLPSPGLNIQWRAVNKTNDFKGRLSSQQILSALNILLSPKTAAAADSANWPRYHRSLNIVRAPETLPRASESNQHAAEELTVVLLGDRAVELKTALSEPSRTEHTCSYHHGRHSFELIDHQKLPNRPESLSIALKSF